MKLTIRTEAIPILLILLSVVASFYFYNNFPEKVPTHWNIEGEVDGWSSKIFATFFFPALIFGMYILFLVIPLIDPKKERYKEFANYYNIFKSALIAFMVLIYFLTGAVGLGYDLPISTITPIGVGLLFVMVGLIMPKLKSNWFMGIRTPWTLSSEVVWNKTHQVGGKIFIIGGILMTATAFLPPDISQYLFLFVVFFIVLGTVGYSYLAYRNQKDIHN